MDGKDSVWICFSDLLAGLMAFFVLVTAGLYSDNLGMEGLAQGINNVPLAHNGTAGQPLVDTGVSRRGKAILFGSDSFGSDKYNLTAGTKARLASVQADLEAYIVQEPNNKILIVGHATCACSANATVYEAEAKAHGKDWDNLTLLEKKNMQYLVLSRYNATLANDRAFSIFAHLWERSEIIQEHGRDKIRYIGLSEQQDAERNGDIKCQEEDRESSKSGTDGKGRAVEIFVVKKWPSALELETLRGDAAPTGESESRN